MSNNVLKLVEAIFQYIFFQENEKKNKRDST